MATAACAPSAGSRDAPPTSSTDAQPGSEASASGSPAVATVDGTFDVGGHELYMRCTGTGSPTVVYLHGYIFDPSGGGSQNAGEVPGLLDERFQVCVYDRANVGGSGAVDGPLTGHSSVRDLEALLDAAEVDGPYLLVGASFGGLLAYMYAASHPNDVVGMVLLDPNLPGFDDGSFDWKGTTERLDQAAASREAARLEGREPDIPVTLLGLEDPEVDFVSSPEEFAEVKAAIMEAQLRFLDLFPDGKLVVVDAPHYMEPVIPDRIVEEIVAVADRA
jgi:pimeloyl-ACP methyl ester carboxylesterase